jgi:SpoVK/Ycf46/Vps4 family AAA+-type ATPase
MKYAFSLARELTPTILFIEDIDNWLHAQATDLMKTEMDGIIKSKGVITILTSNYPERLPPALIDRPGRFHDILNFSLPGPEIRVRMLNKWAPDLKEKTVDMIIKETMKFSGAHMFELISFAKTIAEEDGITMDEAMEISLNKIADQRDLIERLKKVLGADKILKELSNDQSTILQVGESAEGKEGRVLSKKTRSLISDALDGMDKATGALSELIGEEDIKDGSEQDEEAVEEKVEDVIKIIEDRKEDVWNFSDEQLKSAIADAITDVLRDQLKVDAGDIVKNRIDLAKGKVF